MRTDSSEGQGGGVDALARVVSAPAATEPARRTIIDPTGRRPWRRGVLLLTARDLQLRATRFASVIIGTAVVFTLLFVMSGLTEQFQREPRQAVAAMGASGWLVRAGESGAFTSTATMPAATARLVRGVEAAPLVVGRHSITEGSARTDAVIAGFVTGELGEPALTDGRLPRVAGEVAVDPGAGLDVGDPALIGDTTFNVVGLTEPTTLFAGTPFVFMRLDDAQQLLYRGQRLATTVLLSDVPDVVPDGFTVLDGEAVAADALRPLDGAVSSVNLIRVLLWFVAAMIIGTMTYLSALERRRDVAVLKAVGARTSQLGASIALQGALIALVAVAIAAVLQRLVVPVFPLQVAVPGRAFVQLPVIAVAVSLVAGAVGLRKAVGTDPALAFAGPGQ